LRTFAALNGGEMARKVAENLILICDVMVAEKGFEL